CVSKHSLATAIPVQLAGRRLNFLQLFGTEGDGARCFERVTGAPAILLATVGAAQQQVSRVIVRHEVEELAEIMNRLVVSLLFNEQGGDLFERLAAAWMNGNQLLKRGDGLGRV